ncbi:MAG: hypothetical protein IJ468_09840 [Lachnospiraceae bacterium]|nr:hypothetical protein [Lachnospiraceae bacterium]
MPEERTVDMLKAILPFMKPPMKDTMKTCIQLLEIRRTIERLNQEEEELMACSPPAEDASIYDMFQAIRGFCTPKEAETMDMLINFTQMAKFYKEMEGGDILHDLTGTKQSFS